MLVVYKRTPSILGATKSEEEGKKKVAMFGFKKRGATRGLPSGSPKPVLLSPKHA